MDFGKKKENRVWAVKWLVEDVLGFTKEECSYKLKAKHFIKINLVVCIAIGIKVM